MNKRVAIAVVMSMLTVSAVAQFHGVPAGATSLSSTHTMANPPGVPASATSLGPRGFTPGRPIPFQLPVNVNGRRNGQRVRRVIIPVAVPLYSYGAYPYLYPATYTDTPEVTPAEYYADAPTSSLTPPQIVVAPVQQPQVIVIDNRGAHEANDEERQQALATTNAAKKPKQEIAKAEAAPQPEDVGPMTVLVFRDGSRKEIKNYAIMGKELIVFGQGSLRRVQLAELDVPATQKENDVRGLDFRLP